MNVTNVVALKFITQKFNLLQIFMQQIYLIYRLLVWKGEGITRLQSHLKSSHERLLRNFSEFERPQNICVSLLWLYCIFTLSNWFFFVSVEMKNFQQKYDWKIYVNTCTDKYSYKVKTKINFWIKTINQFQKWKKC